MPLIYNGVTIPENVAGALVYNGVSLTQVIFNGIEVWTQSLFSGVWSGNTYAVPFPRNNGGINTSGNAIRKVGFNANSTAVVSGSESPWVYVTSNGFQTIRTPDTVGLGNPFGAQFGLGFTGPWNMYLVGKDGIASANLTYTVGTGWSGSPDEITTGGYSASKLETSGGLMRLRHRDTYAGTIVYGAWISLT